MNRVTRLPDGSYIDYGRHWRLYGKDGEGSARHYSGEAAEVIELLTFSSISSLRHPWWGRQSDATEDF